MDRRTITAILLMLIVVMYYPRIISKFFPNLYRKPVAAKSNEPKADNNEAIQKPEAIKDNSVKNEKEQNIATVEEEIIEKVKNLNEKTIKLKFQDSEYTISNIGAAIKEINLGKYGTKNFKNYSDYPLQLYSIGNIHGLEYLNYKTDKRGDAIIFTAKIPKTNLTITKTIRPGTKKYLLEMTLTIKNNSEKKFYMEKGPVINVGTLIKSKDKKMSRYAVLEATALDLSGKIQRIPEKKINGSIWSDLKYKWVGIQGAVMCYILQNDNSHINGWNYDKKIEAEEKNGKTIKTEIITSKARLPEKEIPAGKKVKYTITYYAGPKLYYHLASIGNDFKKIFNFGTILAPISRFIIWGLNILYKPFKNYGICIIILTIFIKIILYPLTKSSMVSMKKMKELQPQMEEIREKYKDNPQKMNQEIFALYKKHKVNPVSGCFPMLLQLPIFFALFKTLNNAVELKGEQFLWIKDLSLPDTLFHIGAFPVNILPIIMAITQLISQKQTSTDKKQEQMVFFMTIFMLLILYNMPSGLVLYWLVSNILSIIQQWMINKSVNK